jgi:hypothetical protein
LYTSLHKSFDGINPSKAPQAASNPPRSIWRKAVSKKKDNSSTASRRDDHPGKKAEKSKHEALHADQQIVADTNTVFPQHSTADKGVAAKESQIKSNRPGITPREKK